MSITSRPLNVTSKDADAGKFQIILRIIRP